MTTHQEAASDWVHKNPGQYWGGTASLPPAEFINAVEQAKSFNRIVELEKRVEELEARDG